MTLSIGVRCRDGVVLATDSMQKVIYLDGRTYSQLVRTPVKVRKLDPEVWAVASSGDGYTNVIAAERLGGEVAMWHARVQSEDWDFVAEALRVVRRTAPGTPFPDPIGHVEVTGALEFPAGRWWPHPVLALEHPDSVDAASAYVRRVMDAYLKEGYAGRSLESFLAEGKSPAVAYPQHVLVVRPEGTSSELREAA